MSVDPTSQSVTFNISLGSPGLSVNGKTNGGTAITVPMGWKVTIRCHNAGAGTPHSCAVVNTQGNIQFNAATPDPTSGMGAGQTQTFSFTASAAGSYRLACLVPGHEDGGMWASFTVVTSGTPSIT